MSILNLFLFIFSLLLTLSSVNSLYFHIGETEKKCFLEEIPDDTLVIANYKVEIFNEQTNQFEPSMAGFGVHVEVVDPNQKQLMSRTYGADGRITFTSHNAGEHTICLHSNSSAWFGGAKLRVHLEIQVGEEAVDYQKVATKEKLSELELRIRQLLDQVEQIQKEQNYQRSREERFRETSENTNYRVLWWSLAQVIILLCTGLWQLRHLKGFFEAKKLV